MADYISAYSGEQIDAAIDTYQTISTSGSNGEILTKSGTGVTWSTAGTPTQAQTDSAVADWLDAHPEATTTISAPIKTAILNCFAHVAWVDEHGQTYYNALANALAQKEVVSISAVFTQGTATIYTDDTLDDLLPYLVVTATFDDTSTEDVTAYVTLSGTLQVGTNTITVSYSGKTDTFTVTVSEHWSYSLADLTKVTGTFASATGANCGMALLPSGSTNGYRRSFAVVNGETSIAIASGNSTTNMTAQTSNYFPIKIPGGATSFSITITPSTQYVQVLSRVLNDGVYSSLSTPTGWSGYQQGGGTKGFAEPAPNNGYIFVTTKYNDAGTSYPTEPTGLDIVFYNN